MRLVFAR